jgi:flagellar biosynthetic protein FliQ
MTPQMVLDIAKDATVMAVSLAAPILLTGLTIGLLVGMFQAATQIQEMTLTFIPKLLGVFLALLIFGPWLLSRVIEYTINLYRSIPGLVG